MRRGRWAALGLMGALLAALGWAAPAAGARAAPEAAPAAGREGGTGRLKAFYILTGKDVEAPEWPTQYSSYGLFIVSPQYTSAEQLGQAKKDRPDALFLAYTCLGWAYLRAGGCTTFPDNPYFQAMDAHFDSSLAITDLATGNPVCIAGDGKHLGVAGYIVSPAAAEQMASFHAEVTLALPYDGIYVDEFNHAFPNSWIAKIKNQTASFDIDGDGKPDTLGDLQGQYVAFKPTFSRALRQVLGDKRLLIGNTGSGSGEPDPSLNGITIESENCCDGNHGLSCPAGEIETGYKICADSFLGQSLVAPEPQLSILWHTHEYVIPPEVQCSEMQRFQDEMPWVVEGDDFEDGSWHQVCNNTAAAPGGSLFPQGGVAPQLLQMESPLGGQYSDPNHPGCQRTVSVGSGRVSGTDGTGPDGACRQGELVKKWSLPATFAKDGLSMEVDFSPKGGPKDMTGKWNGKDGIIFFDGNTWTKIK